MANSNVEPLYNQIFINNTFVNSVSGKKFPTFNPANKKKITDVAEGDKADIDLAVNAAKAAFQPDSEWRTMDASVRGQLMYKLAELIDEHKNDLAYLESLDCGKPLRDSVSDIRSSVSVLKYYAGYADKIHGKTIPSDGPYVSFTKLQPIGIVGQIIPWNYPILMMSWKLGPALATGCTIVLKPAEQTSLTALYIAALSKEVGFPDGVVNVIPGYGITVGQAISSHPDINKVAFTGSTEVGKLIMAEAAKSNLKRVSLELGGKSPLVIFDDFDVDEAVKIAHDALFPNMGQSCCSGTRTFVQEGIYNEFVKKAAKLASEKKVGDQFDPDTTIWPLVDEKQYNKVLSLIESGIKEGAKVEAGGSKVGDTGYFVYPTVFSNVTDDMRIAKEEIFGPVQQIIKFKTLDEVIKRANNTNYGLAAGVLTKDLSIALKYMENVNAGSMWINCYNAITPQNPFGGFNQSGFGRELGEAGLHNYLEIKTVSIKK
ncbi:Aldehyde/histidinol dehydrogenase,Aldehyde dehydrogenase N-terminal domain,Aldehyde dehydrogenase [Cinara cedri]|uniref:Aldehyde/histidinol dehydrogenase,Aldehyde dehydrogenase N-terminal domain,Aldehyde dehydrogenase n=1 Tax=Cinara cedri TaxID=506608 RepID=A0A5E4MED1_9HEMI|nr:Aldehyde/histidinol dehydrogenase,Aldehyde dehydrogenase N-terminal domain,Aldehyde dehydrogenase [Cinara cedri]